MVLTKIRIPTQSQLTNPKTYSQLTNVPPEYMINSLIISFINKSLHESYPEYIFDKIIMTNNIDILVSGIGIFIDGNLNMILPGSMLPYSIITDKTTYLIYKSCKCFAQNNSNIHNQIYRYISNLHEKTNAHGFTFIGIGGEPYVYANVLQPIYHKYTFVTDSVDVYESCKYNTRDTQFTGTVESQLLVHRNSVGGKGFCSLFTGEACEKGMCMGNDHIIIDGWVKPGWWISACWFFMFDETHKRLMDNNFLVSAHYLRIELSKMTLTRRHKKMGIEYLVSIGTYDKDGELTVFSEVMYGLR
jgi:hypothetical protein